MMTFVMIGIIMLTFDFLLEFKGIKIQNNVDQTMINY
jgi:hypothetical protein